MSRNSIIVLAFAFALGGSALSTSAFARGSAFGRDHRASGGYSSHTDRVGHRELRDTQARDYKWDPWGHWGAYYGPMIGVP